jgi:hypothetical protein
VLPDHHSIDSFARDLDNQDDLLSHQRYIEAVKAEKKVVEE